MAAADNLVSFTRGAPLGKVISTTNQYFDAEVLPSGDLLALSAYALQELTATGALVRNIPTGISLVDARGVEFNPTTGKIYVTMLGFTSEFFRLMRFDGATGQLEKDESFVYGDDLYLLSDGRLLVGSRTQAPGLFDADLNRLGTLGIQQQLFVTQMPAFVPEPASLPLLAAGGLMAMLHEATRRKRSLRPRNDEPLQRG